MNLQDVGVRRGQTWLVRGVTWQIPAQCCAAILGPNGSGKSTLARLLLGQIWLTEGSICVFGQKYGETSLPELRKEIRHVEPASILDVDADMTTRDVVRTGFDGTINLYHAVSRSHDQIARRWLKKVGLQHVQDHPYNTLSSGERMRTQIARSLVHQPKLLILDEPTAGLDLPAREQVLRTLESLVHLKRNRPTMLIITHHLEELPTQTSEVLLLKDGRVLACGSTRRVLNNRVLSRAYGLPIVVSKSQGRWNWRVKR